MVSKLCAIIIIIFLFCGISFAQNKSQEGKFYPDGHGGKATVDIAEYVDVD